MILEIRFLQRWSSQDDAIVDEVGRSSNNWGSERKTEIRTQTQKTQAAMPLVQAGAETGVMWPKAQAPGHIRSWTR